MYLSRVTLNAKKRETMQALVIPSLMHGAVEQSFDGPRQRNLWRVDWLKDQCYLLVVSPEKPDFTHLVHQFGHQEHAQGWETRDYNPLLNRIQEGDTWKFRLKANPVQSSASDKDPTTGRGKVHAHVTQEQQRAWLMKRAEKSGFSLHEDGFDVVHTQWEKFSKSRKGGKEITLRTATFEGALTITNTDDFTNTLKSGIGKAKSYGCGLLTIAP
mgnify:CR=1 FL=1